MNPLNALLDDIEAGIDYGDAKTAAELLARYHVPDDTRTVAAKLHAEGVRPGDIKTSGVYVTFAHRNHVEPVRSPAFASPDAAKGTAIALRLLLIDNETKHVEVTR